MQDLDIGARHIRLYLNSTLVFEGELEKGCGNQVFDYSSTIDLKAFRAADSWFSSPGSSGLNLQGVNPHLHQERRSGEGGGGGTKRRHASPLSSEPIEGNMLDAPLPPIASSQRSSFDPPASEEQMEQVEHTVTTQPSSSRVAPQWLQPLNREAPEGCEASRDRPRWLVPQVSAETKPSSSSASSILPELPCNPGRVCRGAERPANGGQRRAGSLDLSCDLLEELGEAQADRPVSGRRSSYRSASRQTEQQHRAAGRNPEFLHVLILMNINNTER